MTEDYNWTAHLEEENQRLVDKCNALVTAAGKVTCMTCEGTGVNRGWPRHNVPCYACADLRRLLADDNDWGPPCRHDVRDPNRTIAVLSINGIRRAKCGVCSREWEMEGATDQPSEVVK